jgi:hypothetical protein
MDFILRFVFLLSAGLAVAQPGSGRIDAKTRDQVIATALHRLDSGYVYLDVARKMAIDIRSRQARGEYRAFTSGPEFAHKLTEDLRAVSHDKHLHVDYSWEPVLEGHNGRTRERPESGTFGFDQVERLPGNIGYLDLTRLPFSDAAAKRAEEVMSSFAGSAAMIIDLRGNGGGRPAMEKLVASYLFGATPVHLDDLYFRSTGETQQLWTLADVPGRRMPDVDLYLLTSHRTFSGGEALAYDLQCLKRATVVGEVTGGGAHPGDEVRIGEHFTMFVPSGRPINPITKTDWEDVGVRPDIQVSEEKALKTAQLMALKKIASTHFDATIQQLISELEKDLK